MKRALTLICLAAVLGGEASAQEVQREGRYALVPVENGILRLDTVTGEVSRCMGAADASACRLLPDARLAYEAEIRRLEERMDVLEGRMTNLEVPPDRTPGSAPEASGGGLAEDREIDRALDLSERVMRRFFGMVRDLKRDFEQDQL
jgi:hypothetical protein